MTEHNQATLPDIRHTVIMNAPLQKVWDTVATSEGIATWFMPNDFTAEQGHEFNLHTPFGVSRCKVTELNPPTRLVFTWGDAWTISFDLRDVDGRTEFTLTHAGWEVGKINPENGMSDEAVRERMNHGWGEVILPKLVGLVEA